MIVLSAQAAITLWPLSRTVQCDDKQAGNLVQVTMYMCARRRIMRKNMRVGGECVKVSALQFLSLTFDEMQAGEYR